MKTDWKKMKNKPEPKATTEHFKHEDDRLCIEATCSFEKVTKKKSTRMAVSLPDGNQGSMKVEDGTEEDHFTEVVITLSIAVRGRATQKLVLKAEDFEAVVRAVRKVAPERDPHGYAPMPYSVI